MEITYWSDIACPYCYIGEHNMKNALLEMEPDETPKLRFRSYELNPYAGLEAKGDTNTRLQEKYHLTKEGAQQKIDSIESAAADAGLSMKYATTRYTNTRNAHRIIKLAQSKGDPKLSDAIIEKLYEAYFVRNLELSDPSVLMEAGVACGLGSDEIRRVLEGEEFLGEVLDDENQAAQLGVTGVPFFVINGKYAVPGALPKEEMLRVLQKVEAEGAQEIQAEACDGDSCSL